MVLKLASFEVPPHLPKTAPRHFFRPISLARRVEFLKLTAGQKLKRPALHGNPLVFYFRFIDLNSWPLEGGHDGLP